MRTISVALCTHNGARWIGEQLRSIIAQHPAPDEVVISDDASTDDTLAIAERVHAESEAPTRLRILKNPVPLRVTANFEQALLATTGDVIVLSDQDDVWAPDRLALALAVLDAHPEVDLVFGDARIVDGFGAPTGATLFGDLGLTRRERTAIASGRGVDALIRRSLVTGATVLVRRCLVERAAPFPADWVHDEWLAMIAALTSGLATAPGFLIDYRIHGGNQIGITKLTPARAWQRLTAPRDARNRRMAAAWSALEERLPQFGDSISTVNSQLVVRKAAHERFRLELPASRIRRAIPVLGRAGRGDYARYSRGARDVLRDLVQPAS